MEKKKYGGFFYNFAVYAVAMFAASLFPFLAREVSAIFIETNSIQTNLDAAYLFNTVYPNECVLTFFAFIIGGYVACYFTSYKIGYKSRIAQPKSRVKMQMVLCGIFVYGWNMYSGISQGYSGFFGFQFWYPAALTGKWLGLFDITSMMSNLSQIDIEANNFILIGLNDTIGFIIFCYSLIFSVLFTWASYKGRISGEIDGIKAKNQLVEELKKSSTAGR